MLFNNDEVIKLYNEGKSPYEIAEIYGTYANKIRRILKKFVPIRNKSAAQQMAINTGRNEHPTKGKTLSEAVKIKISEKMHSYWKNMSEDEVKNRVEIAKKNWTNIPDDKRKEMQERALNSIRVAAKEGSKLEKHILDVLTEAGYNIQFHRKNLVVNEKLEADLYLPDLNLIIEVDGPSHFLPIWGEDKLRQTMKADADKVGLALNKGFVVVRIKCLVDSLSDKNKRDAKTLILSTLDTINNKNLPKKKRFIELEIN